MRQHGAFYPRAGPADSMGADGNGVPRSSEEAQEGEALLRLGRLYVVVFSAKVARGTSPCVPYQLLPPAGWCLQ